MIVYFSTIVRNSKIDKSGEFVRLDWDTKTVTGCCPITPTNPTFEAPNPRGGSRGGRGIVIGDETVIVSSYHSLLHFNKDFELERTLTHPLFADIHEIDAAENGDIWVSSSALDAALRVTPQGELVDQWWPREDPEFAPRYSLEPLEIDKTKDNRTVYTSNTAPSHVHLNAVTVHNGRPLAVLNRFGMIVRFSPVEIVIEDPLLVGCHNAIVTGSGRIVTCNTHHRSVDVYSSAGKCIRRIDVTSFAPVQKVLRAQWLNLAKAWLGQHGRPFRLFNRLFGGGKIPRPIFVRGLTETDSATVLVGISPAGILELDLESGELVDHYFYSQDVHVCVHGLEAVRNNRIDDLKQNTRIEAH